MKNYLLLAAMIMAPLSLAACSSQSKNMDHNHTVVEGGNAEGLFSKNQKK